MTRLSSASTASQFIFDHQNRPLIFVNHCRVEVKVISIVPSWLSNIISAARCPHIVSISPSTAIFPSESSARLEIPEAISQTGNEICPEANEVSRVKSGFNLTIELFVGDQLYSVKKPTTSILPSDC